MAGAGRRAVGVTGVVAASGEPESVPEPWGEPAVGPSASTSSPPSGASFASSRLRVRPAPPGAGRDAPALVFADGPAAARPSAIVERSDIER
jgi:hypothetical protein